MALLVTLGITVAAWPASQSIVTRGIPHQEGRAWVEEIRCDVSAPPAGWVILRADRGTVEAKPGARNWLRCLVRLAVYTRNAQEARNCLDHYDLKAVAGEDTWTLTGAFTCKANPASLSARFEVEAPLKSNLNISTRAGNIVVGNLKGHLEATTGGGDIRAGNITGPVTVLTGGGGIDVGNVGASVRATTNGGPIQVGNVNGSVLLETQGGEIVAGIVNGPFDARTGGGNITLQAAFGPVAAQTGGGQIHLGQCGNTVRVQTAGGSVQIAGARGGVSVETAGGNINLLQAMGPVLAHTAAGRILARIDANSQTFGPSRLQSQRGDVDVYLPLALPVTINASVADARRHRIISDFPLVVRSHGQALTGGLLRKTGAVLGGGKLLTIQTETGNIQIHKLDPAATAKLRAFQEEFWRNWKESENQRQGIRRQFQALQQQLEQQKSVLEEQLKELDQQITRQAEEPVVYLGGENP
ncbi:MAG: DUF4097 family beta strand repeat-containing protein [Terriglobia bacterium]